MAILKADRIAQLLRSAPKDADPLMIRPTPNPDELERSGAASVDLRLGTWFMSLRQARVACLEASAEDQEAQLTKMHYVPFGKEYILHPRSFVLSVTLEWLRLPGNLAAYVTGKSSWGRRGLVIATATGVHPGFMGCLTLELSNLGEIPVAISPGIRICQLFIHNVDTSPRTEIDQTEFLAHRVPRLGHVRPDAMAIKLAGAKVASPQKGEQNA